jgi:hypothetical protein
LGGIGDTFSALSWIYLLGAGFTVYQLFQHRREFWDDKVTTRDRQLAGSVAFFLLVPVAVLFHEFGHMLAAWSTGSEVLGLHYFFYWGYVEYIPSSTDPLQAWYVALAGNFFSYILGIACIVAALTLPNLKLVLRVVLAQLGILEIVQTLILYPLMSLDPNFHGDWDSIYDFAATPVASWTTLAWHLLSLAGFVYLLRANRRLTYLTGGPPPRETQHP